MAERTNEKKDGDSALKKAAPEKLLPDNAKQLEAEKKELVDSLQRLQAEFENYRKRVEKEKSDCVRIGKAGAVFGLLAVLDSFDAAISRLKKENKQDEGLELLHRQSLQAMQRLGLQDIVSLGKKFNHETMDAIMQCNDNSKEDGIVVEEFLKGYLLDGIVLRHAKVKVNCRAIAATVEKETEKIAGEKKEKE